MGFFDDIQGAVDRGMSTMERGVEIAKINARMREINQQRSNLAAQLGACLYERTKNDPSFTEGLETLYSGIARLDSERIEAQAMIEQLQNQPQQKAPARQLVTCPTCGSFCDPTDMFCCGCGAKVADFAAGSAASAAAGTYYCPKCSAPFEEGDAFCMSCGARLASELPAAEPVFTADPVIAPEPTPVAEPKPEPAPEPQPQLTFQPMGAAGGSSLDATLQPFLPLEQQGEPAPKPAFEPLPLQTVETLAASQPVSPNITPETAASASERPVSGLIFDSPVIPSTPEPEPEPQPSANPQRRFCPECGKVITPGDRFCMICGCNLDGIW